MPADQGGCEHAHGGCDDAQPFGQARMSAQRRVIAEATRSLPGAFTVDDLLRAVRERATEVGVATVYRAVAAMEAAGFVEPVGARDGTKLYARCDHDAHHHHLVCTGCGTTVECDCPIDDRVRRSAKAAGFSLTRHDVTLYGLCRQCARAAEED